ncbi:MAG: hypothetical protein BMS9Abin25_0297 [Gammaproteobacteria bacterium]|nr:MAG: hypothetical protein BMS9Abin25_0297 [Gammaproteobacteria bacterium]
MKNHILPVRTCFFYLLFTVIYWQSPVVIAEQNTIHRDDWYMSQPEESATIQMSGHESEEGAIAFIDSLNLSGEIGYYQTRYKNKPWYAVTYGAFDTLAEARSHLKSLPDDLQRNSPWPRTFKTIKSLINVAEKLPGDSRLEESTVKNAASTPATWEEGQAAYDEGDFSKAFKIWQVLAKQGDELSQFNLGVLYSRGEGAEKSGSRAIEWYIRSAEQGYAPAQFNLGAAYLDGSSAVVDKQKAAAWWKIAAEQGFVQAQFNIAGLYCRGIGVSLDTEQCKFWYRRAASNGDTLARKMLDRIMNNEKARASSEYSEQTVESAAEMDNELAVVAEESFDDERQSNKREQKPEVRKITSQEQIMLRRAQSAFTRNNYMKSHDIWLPLAESGIAEAQYSLGFLYQSGWGPERDIQKAIAWYTNAAEQNEARAQFNLGVLLLNGEDDVKKDTETGVLWLTRSAENNNTRAKEFLIGLYSEGKYGIEKSKAKADYWKSR